MEKSSHSGERREQGEKPSGPEEDNEEEFDNTSYNFISQHSEKPLNQPVRKILNPEEPSLE